MTGLPLLDTAAVDEARAVFKARFPVMAGYYFEDAAGYVANIRQALSAGNVQAVVTPAHTLKSSSRQMGASGVRELAAEIETGARDAGHGLDWFVRHLAQLEKVFEQTRAAYPAE